MDMNLRTATPGIHAFGTARSTRAKGILRFALSIPLAMLVACERAPAPQVDALPPSAADPAQPAEAVNGFAVRVTVSPLAAKQLADGNEAIVVAAAYFGYPTVAAQQREVPGTENPWLTLHSHKVELPSAGTAQFPSVAFDAGDLDLIDRREPQVNINVYSGRKSAQDNLLDCGMFQDTLQVAVQAPVEIDCKLIAE